MRRASEPSLARYDDRRARRGVAMLLGFVLAGVASTVCVAQDLPPAAHPGQCFGRVRYPDAVSLERHRTRVRGAVRIRHVEPAMLRWIATRTLVAPARTELITTPARYRTVARVVTEPGASRWAQAPARYRWDSARALIAPAHLAWVRGRGTPQAEEVTPGQTVLTPTGEVLCRVYIPARYGVRSRRVLISAARRYRVAGPSVRRRLVERVLVAPAHIAAITHPAVYRTGRRAVVLRPARVTWAIAPARWRGVATERRVARAGWAQVVCPAGLAPWAMQRMQSALSARGYDAGPPDGQARPQTYDALRRFQHAQGLAEGQITVESARVLGVVP